MISFSWLTSPYFWYCAQLIGYLKDSDMIVALQATVYIYELIDEEVKVEKMEFQKDAS